MEEIKWLIAREIPRLRRYALVLAKDPASADDLVQDTVERAIRKRHVWRRRGSIRSWLYTILYRIFLNQSAGRRRRQNEVELDAAPVVVEPSSAEQKLACRDVVAAIKELPGEQRAAIALTAIEGLAYDEAADVLDIPIGTLRSRLARGRERLRETYRPPEDAPERAPVLRQVK